MVECLAFIDCVAGTCRGVQAKVLETADADPGSPGSKLGCWPLREMLIELEGFENIVASYLFFA